MMEFKADEKYMFEKSQTVGRSESLPSSGLMSAGGLRNPGLSVGFFVGLSRITGASTPASLSIAVSLLNAFALILLVIFVRTELKENEREPWYWAIALICVHPVLINFHSKIWAQSVLPVFSVALLWSWWRRSQSWASFIFGCVSALIGQIHMSGFFFSLAIWLTIPFLRPGLCFLPALTGLVLGGVPLMPWLSELWSASAAGQLRGSFWNVLQPVYGFYWMMEIAGVGLDSTFGLATWIQFLKSNVLNSVVTLFLLVLTATFILTFGLRMRMLRRPWKESATLYWILVTFVIYGGLLTVSGVSIYRHYLSVTFPFVQLSLSWGAFHLWRQAQARAVLLLFWIGQLMLSLLFLFYIYEGGAQTHGRFGVRYDYQLSPQK